MQPNKKAPIGREEREMSKEVKCKTAKTVGQLIKELEKLPKTTKLSDPMRPVHYNTGESAKMLGLKPQVGFDDGCD